MRYTNKYITQQKKDLHNLFSLFVFLQSIKFISNEKKHVLFVPLMLWCCGVNRVCLQVQNALPQGVKRWHWLECTQATSGNDDYEGKKRSSTLDGKGWTARCKNNKKRVL